MADQLCRAIVWSDHAHAVSADGISATLQRGKTSGRIIITVSFHSEIIVTTADSYEEAVKTAEKEIRLLQEAL